MVKTNEEEEEDLYSDLPNFQYEVTIEKLQATNKELLSRVAHLEEVVEKQTKELEQSHSRCDTLTKNISSLLKTAQNEIRRKDKKINELNRMVLDLRTKVLTSRKRKFNGIPTPIKNKPSRELPPNKRQKTQESPAAEPTEPKYTCDLPPPEKPINSENISLNVEQVKSPVEPVKKVPDIKCHTLYSQRMFDKIYNVDSKSTKLLSSLSTEGGTIETGDKNILNIKSVVNENISKPVETKSSDNEPKKAESKSLFNIFDNNKSLISNNSKLNESDSSLINKKSLKNEVNLASKSCTPKDMTGAASSATKIMSLLRGSSVNKSVNSQILNKRDVIREKRNLLISRTNRSVNFSKTENVSHAVHITHSSKSVGIHDKLFKTSLPDKVTSNNKMKTIRGLQANSVTRSPVRHCPSLSKLKRPIKKVIPPISGKWEKSDNTMTPIKSKEMNQNEKIEANKSLESDKIDIVEALFGSPLKWTENSVEDVKQVPKISPPTSAFEDSCSAHIENAKFKKTGCHILDVKNNVTELSLSKKFSYTERKCYFQASLAEKGPALPDYSNKDKIDCTSSKGSIGNHWPFGKTNNEIPSKNRTITSPTFSTFVNTESTSEACDVPPSLKSNPNTLESSNVSIRVLTSHKYNDSVLGQFDDTTQLISALAKDPSKLSPIHTPIKEGKFDSGNTNSYQSVISPLVSSSIGNDSAPSVTAISPSEKKEPVTVGVAPLVDKRTLGNTEHVSAFTKKLVRPISSSDKSKTASGLLTSPNEKKITIPASVITTVEKKLSISTTPSPSVDKKVFGKRTIFLDKPINILCPRKTPRVVSRCKQNTPQKTSMTASTSMPSSTDGNKVTKSCINDIKSPSPVNEKASKISLNHSSEIITNPVNDYNKDKRVIKNSPEIVAKKLITPSSEKKSISSKSPFNTASKGLTTNEISRNRDVLMKKDVGERSATSTPRSSSSSSSRKERSPVKEQSHHSSLRKENVHRRREPKSPSRKENSPSRLFREKWRKHRESKRDVFKRPEPRREYFKRPNCFFRQSSVERRIAKEWRHSSKYKSIVVKSKKVSESVEVVNSRAHKNISVSNLNTEDRQTWRPTQAPIISRSSKISWSSNTGVVSTELSSPQNSNHLNQSSSSVKWVLKPIEFPKSPKNIPREAKTGELIKTPLNSKNDNKSPVSKTSPFRESFISPNRNSPNKPIVIIAERRPVKFGSNS